MNIPLKIILLFFGFPILCRSQVDINYYDPDQAYPGPWVGDTSLFLKTGNQIVSDGLAQTPSDIFLFSDWATNLPIEWELEASIHCATSSGNFLELLLFSDSSEFSASRLVRIGGTLDEVALIAIDGASETKLIDGQDGIVSSSSLNKIWLKVILTDSLDWNVYFSNNQTTPNWQNIGSYRDSIFSVSGFSGIHVRHSSGNKDKYRIQKFQIRPHIPDTISPTINRVLRINDHQLEVYFSEGISSFSGITSPQTDLSSASISALSSYKYRMTFPIGFILPEEFSVVIDSIEDLESNVTLTDSLNVEKASADFGELVITEVFADPDPPIGPYTDEFVELFNRSDHPIQLENFNLCDASSCMTLPDIILESGEFIILSSGLFPDSVSCYSSSGFPSLNNSEDQLTLKNSSGMIVHLLTYSDQWYDDSEKQEGGYSLECISPDIICGEDYNWTASIASSGATPGYLNSVFSQDLNLALLLKPLYAKVIEDDVVLVEFSGTIHPEREILLAISNGISVQYDSLSIVNHSLFIYLPEPLEFNVLYSLNFQTVVDCDGNEALSQELQFCINDKVNFGDIRVTEILFDPVEEGSDFFEIKNTSGHAIALDQLFFSSVRNGIVYQKREFPPGIYIPSGGVLAFTEDKIQTLFSFSKGNEANIHEVSSLPLFPNETGSLMICSSDSSVISRVDYSSEWHHSSLQSREGVSLTLRNPEMAENNSQNWRSSTFDEGWGTPGDYFFDTASYFKTTASPGVFTPDSDGRDDWVNISVTARSQSLISLMVYNEWGQLVTVLSNEILIGSKMLWAWDGTDSEGKICDKGIYVIFIKAKPEDMPDQFFRYVVQLL